MELGQSADTGSRTRALRREIRGDVPSKIQNKWVLVNFDASTIGGYDIDLRILDTPTDNLYLAHKTTPLRGSAWNDEGVRRVVADGACGRRGRGCRVRCAGVGRVGSVSGCRRWRVGISCAPPTPATNSRYTENSA